MPSDCVNGNDDVVVRAFTETGLEGVWSNGGGAPGGVGEIRAAQPAPDLAPHLSVPKETPLGGP